MIEALVFCDFTDWSYDKILIGGGKVQSRLKRAFLLSILQNESKVFISKMFAVNDIEKLWDLMNHVHQENDGE